MAFLGIGKKKGKETLTPEEAARNAAMAEKFAEKKTYVAPKEEEPKDYKLEGFGVVRVCPTDKSKLDGRWISVRDVPSDGKKRRLVWYKSNKPVSTHTVTAGSPGDNSVPFSVNEPVMVTINDEQVCTLMLQADGTLKKVKMNVPK